MGLMCRYNEAVKMYLFENLSQVICKTIILFLLKRGNLYLCFFRGYIVLFIFTFQILFKKRKLLNIECDFKLSYLREQENVILFLVLQCYI